MHRGEKSTKKGRHIPRWRSVPMVGVVTIYSGQIHWGKRNPSHSGKKDEASMVDEEEPL